MGGVDRVAKEDGGWGSRRCWRRCSPTVPTSSSLQISIQQIHREGTMQEPGPSQFKCLFEGCARPLPAR